MMVMAMMVMMTIMMVMTMMMMVMMMISGGGKRVIRENVELTLVACGRTTTRVLNPFDKVSYFHHHSKLFSLVAWFDFVLPLPSC